MIHGIPDGFYQVEQEGILFDIEIITDSEDNRKVIFKDFPHEEPMPFADLVGTIITNSSEYKTPGSVDEGY